MSTIVHFLLSIIVYSWFVSRLDSRTANQKSTNKKKKMKCCFLNKLAELNYKIKIEKKNKVGTQIIFFHFNIILNLSRTPTTPLWKKKPSLRFTLIESEYFLIQSNIPSSTEKSFPPEQSAVKKHFLSTHRRHFRRRVCSRRASKKARAIKHEETDSEAKQKLEEEEKLPHPPLSICVLPIARETEKTNVFPSSFFLEMLYGKGGGKIDRVSDLPWKLVYLNNFFFKDATLREGS